MTCPTCGSFVGYPNVRHADLPAELHALEERHRASRASAAAEGRLDALDAFETRLQDSCAVVNTTAAFLFSFLSSKKALYSTYSLGVKGQIRKPADPDDDRDRRSVEAILFGGYGEEIRYAALSLDGSGVNAYGPIAIRLRNLAITRRATLLEENSYDFVEHHALRPRHPVPLGYRGTWANRHRVAVAKLADQISSTADEAEFQSILLHSNGDRSTDRFIEVHIYGAFDANAIESVRGSSASRDKGTRADLARVKDLLAKMGRDWVEDA